MRGSLRRQGHGAAFTGCSSAHQITHQASSTSKRLPMDARSLCCLYVARIRTERTCTGAKHDTCDPNGEHDVEDLSRGKEGCMSASLFACWTKLETSFCFFFH